MCRKYRKFESINEAVEWGKKHYAYWLPEYQIDGRLRRCQNERMLESFLGREITEEDRTKLLEYDCFSYYCGGNWGLAINQDLRGVKNDFPFPKKKIEEMIKILDKRLSMSVVHEDIWGYRVLNYADLCKSMGRRYIGCGSVIEDKGYMGVSLLKSIEKEFGNYDTMLKIMIPKGASGLYIDLISERNEEQEILFARGRKLRILFQYKYKGQKVFICKMIK